MTNTTTATPAQIEALAERGIVAGQFVLHSDGWIVVDYFDNNHAHINFNVRPDGTVSYPR